MVSYYLRRGGFDTTDGRIRRVVVSLACVCVCVFAHKDPHNAQSRPPLTAQFVFAFPGSGCDRASAEGLRQVAFADPRP